jgi:hypothetical protein
MDPKYGREGCTRLNRKGAAWPASGEQYEESYDTNHDTNDLLSGGVPAYVIEEMVGTRRLELLTSTVSR